MRRAWVSFWGFVGAIIGSVWLFSLFFLAILYAVLSLTAMQVRDDLSADDKGDYNDVLEAKARFDARKQLLSTTLLRSTPTALKREKNQENSWRAAGDAYLLLHSEESELPYDFDPISYQSSDEFVSALAACGQAAEQREFCDAANVLRQLADEAPALDQAYVDEQSGEAFRRRQAEYDSKLDEMRKSEPLYKYFYTIRFFQEDADFLEFLTWPTEILVLLLTMFMGLLGSVVTMTWSFVRHDGSLTVRRFVVLPLVGMTTAFIVFVFVSAGQLTLTTGSEGGALNPFVLSFVGIISGLLSESAYARISDVGSNFFRGAEAEQRWANGLQAAMDETGVTVTELAHHLCVPEEDVKRIVGETVPATLTQQKLIAACVRRPLRSLFTDAPPEAVGPKSDRFVEAPPAGAPA